MSKRIYKYSIHLILYRKYRGKIVLPQYCATQYKVDTTPIRNCKFQYIELSRVLLNTKFHTKTFSVSCELPTYLSTQCTGSWFVWLKLLSDDSKVRFMCCQTCEQSIDKMLKHKRFTLTVTKT